MKLFFLFIISIVSFSSAFSQTQEAKGKISGKVLDATSKEPIAYATIELIREDSLIVVDGSITDEKGKFLLEKIKPGTYKMKISFMGYKTFEKPSIIVSENTDEIDLGSIFISTDAAQLKEVVVEGQKKVVEDKIDRTVYNAELDPSNKVGDATEVLKKVPMVTVDIDGNPSLRGSAGVRVLIDSKPSSIYGRTVGDALKMFPADQIKSVEVITSPSAKYDAEGSAGIINIITKKNKIQGLTGNLSLAMNLRGPMADLSVAWRKRKVGLNLNYFHRTVNNYTSKTRNTQTIHEPDGTENISRQSYNTPFVSNMDRVSINADYDLDSNKSINAGLSYSFNKKRTDYDKYIIEQITDSSRTTSFRDGLTLDKSNFITGNLNFLRSYKNPEKEFSIGILYNTNAVNYDNRNDLLNDSRSAVVNGYKNLNNSQEKELTIQTDFQIPLHPKFLIETGVKNIFRKSKSDYQYYLRDFSPEYVLFQNSNYSNNLQYNQNVTAAYFSNTWKLPKDFTVKSGLRYEYTYINARFGDNSKSIIPSYGILVPSINFGKKLKEGAMVKISYSRRIQRPWIGFLNPNIQAANPLNVTQGNPGLHPEFSNMYELGYSKQIKIVYLSSSLFARTTANSIQTVRDVHGDTVRNTYLNIGKQASYGAYISGSLKYKIYSSTLGGSLSYTNFSNGITDPQYHASNKGFSGNVYLQGTITLPKGWSVQAFGNYMSRSVQLQGYSIRNYYYTVFLKRDFLKDKKATISFSATNFLSSPFKRQTIVNTPLVSIESVNYVPYSDCRINLVYRFGKMSMSPPRKKKTIRNDDQKSSE